MFVVMAVGATEEQLNAVRGAVLEEGLTPHENRGGAHIVVAVLGEGGAWVERLADRLSVLPGVESVTRTTRPFKLTSREFHPEDTIVQVGDVAIGDGSLTLAAGPCAIESRDQLFETAEAVKAAGANVLRGGAFKPRTSPYSFQGLGLQGLRYLAEARERTGLPVVTEVMEPGQVEHVAEYADILQIGARNMQNYSLLMAVGRIGRPVLLKRGLSGTIEEWVMAAEYVMSSGNPNVILCERGIRTFETAYRNTLDVTVGAAHPPADPPAGDDRPVARRGEALARARRWRSPGRRPVPTACSSRSTRAPSRRSPTATSPSRPAQFAELAIAARAVHEQVRAIHATRGPAMAAGARA